jgi:hypothetical protein
MSTPLGGKRRFVRPSLAIVSFPAGKTEIITRSLAALLSSAAFLLFVVSLVFSHSPSIATLPTSFRNCSLVNIKWLNPAYLAHSVNVFSGTSMAITALAVLYQIIVLFARFLNFELINDNFNHFVRLDIIVNTIFMTFFIAVTFGCFIINWMISTYISAFDNYITTDAFRNVTILLWIAFGVCISALYQYFSMAVIMTAYSCKEYNYIVADYNMELQEQNNK